MKIDKSVFVGVASWMVALLFLVTALLKAVAAANFAQTIVSYGFPHFQFMAPVIIEVEVLVALFLIFGIHTKWTALGGSVMVAGFTLLYTYALVFKGITDCGCFGGLSALNNSPAVFYVKNAVLMALLLFVFFKADDGVPQEQWVYAVVIAVMAFVGFQAGLTYESTQFKKLPKPTALSDSPLHKFIQTSPDSTYVVFAFSYSCPHCLNSMGNVKDYVALDVADRVIGLAVGDSLTRQKFLDVTQPNFPIHDHGRELMELTTSFPRTYYIARDSIRYDMKGEAVAAYILKRRLSQ